MYVVSTVFDCSLLIISAFVVVAQVLLAATCYFIPQSAHPL